MRVVIHWNHNIIRHVSQPSAAASPFDERERGLLKNALIRVTFDRPETRVKHDNDAHYRMAVSRKKCCASSQTVTSHVTRYTSHVSHTSHVTRHTSHVTRHTSHVTRHTSHVTRHTSQAKGMRDCLLYVAGVPLERNIIDPRLQAT